MKRCPACRRDYYDNRLLYCLDDGSALLEGPALGDEPETAIYADRVPLSESPTKPQIHSADRPEIRPAAISNRGPLNRKAAIVACVAALLALTAFLGYRYFDRQEGEQIKSIAVLPFENQSGNADAEYLSDGLSDSLIYRLTQLPNLKVSPTNSVIRYKGNQTDVEQIAKELDVDAVMSGKLAQRGEALTISVQLTDARTKKLIWAEQYDRKMSDLLATQREIARQIVIAMALKVSGDEKGLSKRFTENNEAYQLYLKGRYFWGKRTPESIGKAIEYFNQAIEKDSSFALAYVGLADAWVVPATRFPPREAMPKAKAAALRALEIDDTLAEAHTSLARVMAVYDWNWLEAEREFKRAIELDPRYPVAHQWYGGYLERLGRLDESIAQRKLAIELDPLSAIANFELGQAYFFSRDFDKALEQFDKAIELDPGFPAAIGYIPVAYVQKGMFDKAIQSIKSAPENPALSETGSPGYVYAMAGRTKEARAMIEELKRLRDDKFYISPLSIASIYAGLGEKDEAFAWLEKGFEDRSFQIQMLKVDPRWDKVRSDPRFRDLIKRVGLPADN